MKKCEHKQKEPLAYFGDTDCSDYPEVLILECAVCKSRFWIVEKKLNN